MLTNREKEDALLRKLRKYNYFIDGDIKLTKEDAALVIRLFREGTQEVRQSTQTLHSEPGTLPGEEP